MNEIIKFIPILIMTLAMITVSFIDIKKSKKKMAVIITFVLWLSVFAISWNMFWK